MENPQVELHASTLHHPHFAVLLVFRQILVCLLEPVPIHDHPLARARPQHSCSECLVLRGGGGVGFLGSMSSV